MDNASVVVVVVLDVVDVVGESESLALLNGSLNLVVPWSTEVVDSASASGNER